MAATCDWENPIAMKAGLLLPLPTLGGKQLWADLFVFSDYRIQESVVTGRCRLLGPQNLQHAAGTYEECRAVFDDLRQRRKLVPIGDHLVLLLHGMFRAKESFGPMRRRLRREGFEAVAVNYPSTQRTLEQHTAQVRRILDAAEGVRTVSFVGHSMGGIIARLVVAHGGSWMERLDVHRLVTLGTPHHGAEMVNRLRELKVFQALAGPAGMALATEFAPDLPLPTCRFGCVAGARGDGRGWNPMLEGEDDGTVALSSALLDGAEDTLVVPGIHTFLMQRPDVIEGTISYLRSGRFRPLPG
jgi:triacylglycerol esterase/lipase EstA (alpha/beta hydrolase family)